MCGRYNERLSLVDLENHFPWPFQTGFEWEPRYNIAPTQLAPVVADLGRLHIALFRWGLIPRWADDAKIGNRMINARIEKVETSPAYRAALKRRRCLVVATGFYEWRKDGKTKTPVHVHRKDDGPITFAGLWDAWQSPDGEEIRSYTILTGEPNALVKPIHDRMPVVVPEDMREAWIVEPPEKTLPRLREPHAGAGWTAEPISRAVNSPANDTPEILEPVGEV